MRVRIGASRTGRAILHGFVTNLSEVFNVSSGDGTVDFVPWLDGMDDRTSDRGQPDFTGTADDESRFGLHAKKMRHYGIGQMGSVQLRRGVLRTAWGIRGMGNRLGRSDETIVRLESFGCFRSEDGPDGGIYALR